MAEPHGGWPRQHGPVGGSYRRVGSVPACSVPVGWPEFEFEDGHVGAGLEVCVGSSSVELADGDARRVEHGRGIGCQFKVLVFESVRGQTQSHVVVGVANRGLRREGPRCVVRRSAPVVVVRLSLRAKQGAHGFGGIERSRLSVDDHRDISDAVGSTAVLSGLKASAFDDRLYGVDGTSLARWRGEPAFASLAG